ncbi:HindIII family type II restriction endonuclease [Pectobacterium sp. HCp5_1]|uniref:HindIII family type II restriction endonuclease n=1 Tax=Pectobacterium sp. HCp5_1 TaxID=3062446 RepID=UPI00293C08FE|nr:HindIII family type II restriction endonuclease [Pectobacterium sp. HCp5_1]
MLDIEIWFEKQFTSINTRYHSYESIHNFIQNEHQNWNTPPNTDLIVKKFSFFLRKLTLQEFSFMLCHSGYIPELYKADSSQETLYSKLVEVMVCEWALRINFRSSTLPTQKSSKEDITISDGENIIVADAKSYRLGRSQAAPNVKDALKKGDITKWLSHYNNYNRIGGLVAFPSQHDWKNGSDFYLYLTDKKSPIIMLFYEHMAFMLLNNMNKEHLLSFYRNHENIFPNEELNKTGSRQIYFDKLEKHLLNCGKRQWSDFSKVAEFIITEKVTLTLQSLQNHLIEEKNKAVSWTESLSIDEIKCQLADVKYQLENQNFIRQIDNIRKFRKFS